MSCRQTGSINANFVWTDITGKMRLDRVDYHLKAMFVGHSVFSTDQVEKCETKIGLHDSAMVKF